MHTTDALNPDPLPALVWTPSLDGSSRYEAFVAYCAAHCQDQVTQHAGAPPWSPEAFHRWSVADLSGFWSEVSDFFEIDWVEKPVAVFEPGPSFYQTRWFRGGKLSYAAHVLAQKPTRDRL